MSTGENSNGIATSEMTTAIVDEKSSDNVTTDIPNAVLQKR